MFIKYKRKNKDGIILDIDGKEIDCKWKFDTLSHKTKTVITEKSEYCSKPMENIKEIKDIFTEYNTNGQLSVEYISIYQSNDLLSKMRTIPQYKMSSIIYHTEFNNNQIIITQVTEDNKRTEDCYDEKTKKIISSTIYGAEKSDLTIFNYNIEGDLISIQKPHKNQNIYYDYINGELVRVTLYNGSIKSANIYEKLDFNKTAVYLFVYENNEWVNKFLIKIIEKDDKDREISTIDYRSGKITYTKYNHNKYTNKLLGDWKMSNTKISKFSDAKIEESFTIETNSYFLSYSVKELFEEYYYIINLTTKNVAYRFELYVPIGYSSNMIEHSFYKITDVAVEINNKNPRRNEKIRISNEYDEFIIKEYKNNSLIIKNLSIDKKYKDCIYKLVQKILDNSHVLDIIKRFAFYNINNIMENIP